MHLAFMYPHCEVSYQFLLWWFFLLWVDSWGSRQAWETWDTWQHFLALGEGWGLPRNPVVRWHNHYSLWQCLRLNLEGIAKLLCIMWKMCRKCGLTIEREYVLCLTLSNFIVLAGASWTMHKCCDFLKKNTKNNNIHFYVDHFL